MPGNSTTSAALLTTAEAARLLKINVSAVEQMAKTDMLSVQHSDGLTLYFALQEVLALANKRQEPASLTERHTCLFVRQPEQFGIALLPLITARLAAGATVLLILDQVQTRLEMILADPVAQQALTDGRLQPLEAEKVYLEGNNFDTGVTINRLADLTRDLIEAGQPVVLVGEISKAACHQHSDLNIAHYETELNDLLSEQLALSALCVYDISQCDGGTALAALQSHPEAWIDGVCRTGLAHK